MSEFKITCCKMCPALHACNIDDMPNYSQDCRRTREAIEALVNEARKLPKLIPLVKGDIITDETYVVDESGIRKIPKQSANVGEKWNKTAYYPMYRIEE